jgi:hypothetical protein
MEHARLDSLIPGFLDSTEPPIPPNAPNGACDQTIPVREVIEPIREAVKKRSRSGKRGRAEIRIALGERLPWWEKIWEIFPCKDGETPGMDAFERRVHDHDLAQEIWKGAKRYAAKYAADPTIRLKYFSGWLTEERWMDATTIPAPSNGNTSERPSIYVKG